MAVALVVAATACSPSQQPADPLAASSPCSQLIGAVEPTLISITASEPAPADIVSSRDALFRLGAPETVELLPPVDWQQDPYNDRSWRYRLHTLGALYLVLLDYQDLGRPESLQYAVDLSLDWIDANPLNGAGLSEFAWYDTAVGIRVSYMSYIIAELENKPGTVDASVLEKLRCSATDHAEWLFDDANYKPRHNHGLYEDAGLFVAALNLVGHPRAADWRLKAETRFSENVTDTFDTASGLHLEHSPTYHETITETVANLVTNVGLAKTELGPLVDRMYGVGGWYVMPDGFLPQFGDTDRRQADTWMVERSADAVGVGWFPEAGLAVYREPDAYVGFVSWHHSTAHKHSDELTFVWAEAGERIIIDSGRYGYYYDDPARVYAESSSAHNTVSFGGDAFAWRDAKPYGSGLIDYVEADGWVAFMGENRNTKSADFTHRRALLYRPGVALVVVDAVEGEDCAEATGYLHFAPQWNVVTDSVLAGDSAVISTSAQLEASTSDAVVSVVSNWHDLSFVVGEDEPVQGFTFPANRVQEVSAAAILQSESGACSQPLVTVLTLGDAEAVSISSAMSNAADVRIADTKLSVTLDSAGLSLSVVDE